MKHKIRQITFIFLIVFLAGNSYGQRTLVPDTVNYAGDSLHYLQQLTQFLGKYDEEKAEVFAEKFRPVWMGSYYTEEEKDSIIALANDYLIGPMQPVPHFLHYFQALMAFAESETDKQVYEEWQEGLRIMVANEDMYFKITSALLKNTALWLTEYKLMDRNGVFWRADTAGTHFTYEQDTLFLDLQTSRLTGYFHGDSMVVYDVKGRYNPGAYRWHGEEGRVSWQKLGVKKDSVYVELGRHKINLKRDLISDKQTKLHHKGLLQGPVEGSFEHMSIDKAKNPRYPQFRSYNANLELRNVYPGVDFRGGIFLRGKQFFGMGRNEETQFATFHQNAKEKLKAKATTFVFGKDKMEAEPVEISVYFGKDSLYHPKVNLRYYPDTQRVELINPTRGKYRYLFGDTRHKYDIDAGKITWYMHEPYLRFGSYGLDYRNSIIVQSSNYMSPEEYQQYNNTPDVNPIDRMMAFAKMLMEQTGKLSTPFVVRDVAKYMNMYPNSAYQIMLRMKESGFLKHHKKENYWTFTMEFFKYHAQANEQLDYDRIRFKASVDPPIDTTAVADSTENPKTFTSVYKDTTTAKLDITSGDLHLYGVDSIPIASQIAPQPNTRDNKKSAARDSAAADSLTAQQAEAKKKDQGLSQVAMKKGSPYGKEKKSKPETKNISIKPANGSLTMTRNHNFLFDGQVQVGDFLFVGTDFRFDYDNFTIDLDSVKYMTLKTKLDELDEQKDVENKIVDLSGYIELGEPDNKSGMEVEDVYPRFVSKDSSYVYYDDSTVMQVAYPRDQVYFQLDPYEIESMNRRDGSELELTGTFYSGDILPKIRDTLRLMVDTNYTGSVAEVDPDDDRKDREKQTVVSFGFSRETTSDGLPIYSEKASLHKRLRMSVKGLVANGTFNYRNATLTANDFEFTTEEMSAQALALRIDRSKGNPAFPTVDGVNMDVRWVADADSFIVKTIPDEGLKMDSELVKGGGQLADYSNIFNQSGEIKRSSDSVNFNGKLRLYADLFEDRPLAFSGTLVMTLDSLIGNGKVNMFYSDYTAKHIDFRKSSLSSKQLDNIVINEPSVPSDSMFVSQKVQADIDLEKMQANLQVGDGQEQAFFPVNDYITHYAHARWNISDKTMQLQGRDKQKMPFVSTHRHQDSLSFKGKASTVDIAGRLITVEGVDSIMVADASVLPSTPVQIRDSADMDALANSRIHVKNKDIRHRFFKATTKIHSAHSYTADGKYTYTDKAGRDTTFLFEKLYTRRHNQNFTEKYITHGQGEIGKRTNPFQISPHFDYYGSFQLRGDRQFLYFKGKTRPRRRCDTSMYVNFNTRINPQSIVIPLNDTIYNESYTGRGFYIKGSGVKDFRNHFIDSVSSENRVDMLEANGYLTYSEQNDSYFIYELNEKDSIDERKNMVWLNKESCDVYGEGVTDFALKAPQVQMRAAGSVNYDQSAPEKERYSMKLLMALKFKFNQEALEELYNKLFEKQGGEQQIDPLSPAFVSQLNDLLPPSEVKSYKQSVNEGFTEAPASLSEYQLVLGDVDMKWDPDPDRISFVANDRITVAFLNGRKVFRDVDAIINIEKQQEEDRFHIHFQIDDSWYYFRYSSEKLSAVAADDQFNQLLEDTKRRNRKFGDYEFDLGQISMRTKFHNKFTGKAQGTSVEESFGGFDVSTAPDQQDNQGRPQFDQKDFMPDTAKQDTSATQGGAVNYGQPSENKKEGASEGGVQYGQPSGNESQEQGNSGLFEEEGEKQQPQGEKNKEGSGGNGLFEEAPKEEPGGQKKNDPGG